MNKIFKLLAVLMLFSALSTGSMTVHAETVDVAQIVGGNTYASLEAAVEAAGTPESAVEIELLADTALTSAVIINDNVILDLNGKTLNLSSYDLSLSTSGKVVDNSDAQTGLLTTSGGKFNSNTQMAVYNTAKSGYVVADIKHQEAILTEASTGEFKLVFKPDFGTTVNSLLGNSGTDAKVNIRILLSWDGGSQTFTYTSDMIKDVYTNSGRAFYITVTNFTNVANVKATPQIVSDLGADCRGTAHTLTEKAATIVLKKYGDTEGTTAVTGTDTMAAIEAEDVIVDKDYVAKKTDEYATNASGKVVARVSTAQETNNETPKPATESPALGFEITPDKDGTYYIWARVYRKGSRTTDARFIFVSLGESEYSLKNLQNTAALNDYTWINLGSISGEANKSTNVRFRTRQGNLSFDKFIVTTDETYIPTGTGDLTAVE